ncbi:MAG TPA: isoprenylcysteine carboxylmethyltransferase family protein [Alphaproteobacteria bacterium]|nr:isoprenylcysteine carboxylmethyltransferase family protein [Alphaproteobacteria bacterium]
MVIAEMAAEGAKNDIAGAAVRPPRLHLAAIAVGFALDWIVPTALAPSDLSPSWRAAIGGGLVALGAALFTWSIGRFRAADTPVPTIQPTRALVADGPYRFSRNPIYLSMAVIHAGIALAADNAWVLLLLAPTLIVIRYGVIAREERYLERKFGADYLAYKRQVRRWV